MRMTATPSSDPVKDDYDEKERGLDADTLNEAIKNNAFLMYYQPQIDLLSGKVVGFEGLLKWQHPALGVLPAETLIPLAEHTGHIRPLTQLMIHLCFKFIQEFDHEVSCTLNISTKCIKDNHLINSLNRACDRF